MANNNLPIEPGSIAMDMMGMSQFDIKTAGEILNDAQEIQRDVLKSLKETDLTQVAAPAKGQLFAYLSKGVTEGLRNISFATGGPTERIEGTLDKTDFLKYLTNDEIEELEGLVKSRQAKLVGNGA